MNDLASVPAVLVGVSAAVLIMGEGRRVALVVLAIQYAFVAWLTGLALPAPVAAVKLVQGMFASALLALTVGLGHPAGKPLLPRELPSGRAFRISATLLVATAAAGLGLKDWMGLPNMSPPGLLGSTLLMALGLLQLGLSEDPFRVGLGLLTLISGFEVVYSALEPSLAVLALLAAVHMGIAVVVSYLLSVAAPAEESPEASQ
jgi:hypothetical protein